MVPNLIHGLQIGESSKVDNAVFVNHKVHGKNLRYIGNSERTIHGSSNCNKRKKPTNKGRSSILSLNSDSSRFLQWEEGSANTVEVPVMVKIVPVPMPYSGNVKIVKKIVKKVIKRKVIPNEAAITI
jgi:hypothetical protein